MKFVVLRDFDESADDYDELCETAGILKAEVEKEFEVENGK